MHMSSRYVHMLTIWVWWRENESANLSVICTCNGLVLIQGEAITRTNDDVLPSKASFTEFLSKQYHGLSTKCTTCRLQNIIHSVPTFVLTNPDPWTYEEKAFPLAALLVSERVYPFGRRDCACWSPNKVTVNQSKIWLLYISNPCTRGSFY